MIVDHTKHFSREELACPCCGECKMDAGFMRRIELMRVELGFPFSPSTAYRCEKYEEEIGGSGEAHPKGRGMDIPISGEKAYQMEVVGLRLGFRGKGSRQHGPHKKRFLHWDDLKKEEHSKGTRPWCWTYK